MNIDTNNIPEKGLFAMGREFTVEEAHPILNGKGLEVRVFFKDAGNPKTVSYFLIGEDAFHEDLHTEVHPDFKPELISRLNEYQGSLIKSARTIKTALYSLEGKHKEHKWLKDVLQEDKNDTKEDGREWIESAGHDKESHDPMASKWVDEMIEKDIAGIKEEREHVVSYLFNNRPSPYLVTAEVVQISDNTTVVPLFEHASKDVARNAAMGFVKNKAYSKVFVREAESMYLVCSMIHDDGDISIHYADQEES